MSDSYLHKCFASAYGVLAESRQGFVLKLLALAARCLFLVLIVPRLLPGELAIYVYVSGVAIILSILISFGLDEALPKIIAGDANQAVTYLPAYFVLQSVSIFLLAALIIYPFTGVAIAAFALAVAAGRYLGGVLRSLDAGLFERLNNLPWLLFLLLAFATGLQTGLLLISLMAFGLALSNLVCLYQSKLSISWKQPDIASIYKLASFALRSGGTRLLSALFLYGATRGPVLWAVWLTVDVSIDELALVIAIGEVVTQFGLVPVHRQYSKWCRSGANYRTGFLACFRLAVLVTSSLCVLSLVAAALLVGAGILPPQLENPAVLYGGLTFFSFLPMFWLVRYLLWARNIQAWTVVTSSAVIFLAVPFAIKFSNSTTAFLILTAVVVFVSVSLPHLVRRDFIPA